MAQVVLENLTKTFTDGKGRTTTAVNGVSLTIKSGEFMVLVGPSGCGKSTTLRMIAGLESVSSGTVSIDGRRANDVHPKDRDIAMVFQSYALYPHMTAYENMAFSLRIRKLPTPEIDTRVREAAAMLGLEALLDRRPGALSGGQRQRVAVGRAIVRKPKVFLFDEPLSNLDAKMRASMRIEISRLHARLGATMIYVTHDQIEAMSMGDRICVMRDGEIQQTADPFSIYQRPANLFVAGFIGTPPMNQITGTLTSEATGLRLEIADPAGSSLHIPVIGSEPGTGSGQRVVLGLRPEDLYDSRQAPTGAFRLPFECAIDLVEPMGSDTFLHFSIAGTPCVAKVRPTERYAAGQRIRFALDVSHAHLFDASAGRNLLA